MAFYRRQRRRSTGVWLPTLDGANPTTYNTLAGQSTVEATPIVGFSVDLPVNTTNFAGANLDDFFRSGYVTKRIVGSIFCHVAGVWDSAGIMCFAGIVVRRVTQTGAILDLADLNPFGAGTPGTNQIRWLWRRSWRLSPFQAIGGPATQAQDTPYPSSNARYGSIREGTFLDCKAKAHVEYQNRLFLVKATLNTTAAAQDTFWNSALRLYASPMKTYNR